MHYGIKTGNTLFCGHEKSRLEVPDRACVKSEPGLQTAHSPVWRACRLPCSIPAVIHPINRYSPWRNKDIGTVVLFRPLINTVLSSRWCGKKVQETEYSSSAWSNLFQEVSRPSAHVHYDLSFFFYSETYELIFSSKLLWGRHKFDRVICFVMWNVVWGCI